MAVATGQISIGDPVVTHPGVYIPHGQVVMDARTEVRAGVPTRMSLAVTA